MSEIIQEKYTLDEKTRKLLYEELPKLFHKNPLVKYAIWDICNDKFADKKTTEDRFERLLEELKKERERNDQRFEKFDKRFEKLQEELRKDRERNDQRFEKLQEELRRERERNDRHFEIFEKRFEKFDQRFEEMQKEIKLLAEKIGVVDKRIDRTIGALGARWGLNSEKAFRDAIRSILSELTNYKVEHFLGYDNEGMVFGRPDQIELDVVIKNGQIWLIEIKSSVSKADVYIFQRKVEFYEQQKKVKVDKKIIISPMVENAALDLARDMNIDVYSQPEEISTSA